MEALDLDMEQLDLPVEPVLLSPQVIVLADDGVDQLSDSTATWDDVVGRVLHEVRQTRLVEGIVAGVDEIGARLARHLPAGEHLKQLPSVHGKLSCHLEGILRFHRFLLSSQAELGHRACPGKSSFC